MDPCEPEEFFGSENLQGRFYFCITFDDIYQNVLDTAVPILEKFHLPYLLFPSVGFMDQDLFWWDKFRFAVLAAPLGDLDFFNERFFMKDIYEKNRLIQFLEPILSTMPLPQRNEYIEKLYQKHRNHIERQFGKVLSHFRPATTASLKKISTSRLCRIGSHGVNHLVADNLTEQDLENEMQGSRQWLIKELCINPTHYCYPNGSDSAVANLIALRAGYTFAHVIRDDGIYWNTPLQGADRDLTLIHRLPVDDTNLEELLSSFP